MIHKLRKTRNTFIRLPCLSGWLAGAFPIESNRSLRDCKKNPFSLPCTPQSRLAALRSLFRHKFEILPLKVYEWGSRYGRFFSQPLIIKIKIRNREAVGLMGIVARKMVTWLFRSRIP
ncbi:MAG: hypothetical protein BECKG1743F_GA0114225_109761 [Candidatus Kentron sp. G]|nr:MAG: hypothetical protein BECKG1743F_GA0114225_109761 [Candidatus Kentron sp. G]